jgi:ribose-phosphate pyrophosphokinase
MRPIIIPLPGNEKLAQSINSELRSELGELELRRFPDGEIYIRVHANIEDCDVVLIQTLDEPDTKILPLLFTAATARDLGAASIGLAAPYLAYMRQDQRFNPGEGVTSGYFATLISQWFDWLVTIDPHLHRHSLLSEIYSIPAKAVHAAPHISKWIMDNVPTPLLIGPDSESEQWVSSVAQGAEAPYVILEKTRRGDRDVEISVPEVLSWTDRTPVLVDDIISTASTMIETIGHLKTADLKPPTCIGVHGIFAENAYSELLAAGIDRVVTSNSIPHETNAIDLSNLLSGAIVRHLDLR